MNDECKVQNTKCIIGRRRSHVPFLNLASCTPHFAPPLPSVLCPLPSALCLLSSVLCPLRSVLCSLSSALCPLSSVFCPLSSALCPLPSVLCPLPSALCPLPSALCPLPSILLHIACFTEITGRRWAARKICAASAGRGDFPQTPDCRSPRLVVQ